MCSVSIELEILICLSQWFALTNLEIILKFLYTCATYIELASNLSSMCGVYQTSLDDRQIAAGREKVPQMERWPGRV